MQIDKLKAIVAGEIKGEEAAEILCAARRYVDGAEKAAMEVRKAISEAEGVIVYGPEGRPQKTKPSYWQAPDNKLMARVLDWENSARQQFLCAERTDDPMGKRVMEHGATVYFNCAARIREYLFSP